MSGKWVTVRQEGVVWSKMAAEFINGRDNNRISTRRFHRPDTCHVFHLVKRHFFYRLSLEETEKDLDLFLTPQTFPPLASECAFFCLCSVILLLALHLCLFTMIGMLLFAKTEVRSGLCGHTLLNTVLYRWHLWGHVCVKLCVYMSVNLSQTVMATQQSRVIVITKKNKLWLYTSMSIEVYT